jgi:GNAT superfamily N-acetyltransferase
MVATEPLAIVRLDASDTASGLLLSAETHWNQNEADWRFFLETGNTFGVRDADGRLIATAALLPHTASDAWISMVLVTSRWRRRGLATRLVDFCLATANALKLTTWLDATPAGAVVYGPLGFTPMLELQRLRLQISRVSSRASAPVEPLASYDLEAFIAHDRCAMGFDRSVLLGALGRRADSRLVSNGDAVALVRSGRTARHIGPLFATDPERALALVRSIAIEEGAALLLDVVASRQEFLAGLVRDGWSIERPFQRMRFGIAGVPSADPPFAIAGPEYG